MRLCHMIGLSVYGENETLMTAHGTNSMWPSTMRLFQRALCINLNLNQGSHFSPGSTRKSPFKGRPTVSECTATATITTRECVNEGHCVLTPTHVSIVGDPMIEPSAPLLNNSPTQMAPHTMIPQNSPSLSPPKTPTNPSSLGKSYQIQTVPTPVKADKLNSFLAGYADRDFLVQGFTHGFHIPYTGERKQHISSNLQSVSDKADILRAKIEKEVLAGRVGGPYNSIPLPNLQVSPLGLVPKKAPNEYRVIHHLSYPPGESINDGISQEYRSVTYQTVDDAVRFILDFGQGTLMAKTDIEHAYKIVPIHPDDYELLGFQVDNLFYYDRTLPMGLSYSCQLFEKFSSSIHWILNHKFNIEGCVHILDDFLFLGKSNTNQCKRGLLTFCEITKALGVPLKEDKTVYPTTVLTFLGLELDSEAMEIRLPQDKLAKLRTELLAMSRRKKATLQQLQSLIGLLNFACSVVIPGRTFLRRIIDLTIGLSKPQHYRRLTLEARADIAAWLLFIVNFNGRALFLPTNFVTSESLDMYTDASNIGMGGYLRNSWFCHEFSPDWLTYPITVREFLPIVVAIELWHNRLENRRIQFYSDNMAVVHIINKHTSKCPTLMKLMRRFMVSVLKYNIFFQAVHVPGASNIAADHLSRLQMDQFHHQFPHMDKEATLIPPHLLTL